MKKSTIAVIAVIAALTVGVAVLAVLNNKNAAPGGQAQAAFWIKADGAARPVTMEDIEALGPREIQANYKKSGKNPEKRVYTGVPFAQVLASKGIDCAGAKTAVFSASDGYSSILSIGEALDGKNCYIVLDDGEDGPFRMILPNARFSQNWCKLLTEVTIK